MRRFRRQVLHREVTLPHRVIFRPSAFRRPFFAPCIRRLGAGRSRRVGADAGGPTNRPFEMLEASFAPGRNGAFWVTRRIASPPQASRQQPSRSPAGRESASPHFSKQHVPDAPGRNASRFCTPPRPPFSRVCLRPQEKSFRLPQAGAGANSPRRQTFFPRNLPRKTFFLPRPGSCARTTSPHALRNNNMRRRASLAFSPSASFSGHAPLPRALFFHRARRRTRPFFIYKHPG